MELKEAIAKELPSVLFLIDDSILGPQEAFESDKDSLWESGYYGFVKSLHDMTGAIINCALLYENDDLFKAKQSFNLSMIDDRYKREFQEASPWLKFSPHALNFKHPMITQKTEEVQSLVDNIREAVINFAGKDSLSKTWIPHFYAADRDACEIMKDYGIEVMLTADDKRKTVACLDINTVRKMQDGGCYEDPESGFLLMHTSFRIGNPNKRVEDLIRIIDDDIKVYGVSAFYASEQNLVITGEDALDQCSGNNISPKDLRERTTELLTYAKEKGLTFVE